jgi:uncharacterized protein YodC (DUF2158 family)
MTAARFSVGEIVQLKSGGPKMSVKSIDADEDVYCSWFAGSKLSHGHFKPDQLVAVPETSGAK